MFVVNKKGKCDRTPGYTYLRCVMLLDTRGNSKIYNNSETNRKIRKPSGNVHIYTENDNNKR